MDQIFGGGNFLNEIAWGYNGGGVPKNAFSRKHDIVLSYAKKCGQHTFNRQFQAYSEKSQKLVRARGGVSIDGKPRDLERGCAMTDWWGDIQSLQTMNTERLGYPTQKPLALLERIIQASSNKGDVVLDPYMGSGTTIEAAAKLGRNWIGMDVNKQSLTIAKQRLEGGQSNLDLAAYD